MLVELDGTGEDVDVVIGAEQRNETDHSTADGLNPALAVKAQPNGTLNLAQLWRRTTGGAQA